MSESITFFSLRWPSQPHFSMSSINALLWSWNVQMYRYSLTISFQFHHVRIHTFFFYRGDHPSLNSLCHHVKTPSFLHSAVPKCTLYPLTSSFQLHHVRINTFYRGDHPSLISPCPLAPFSLYVFCSAQVYFVWCDVSLTLSLRYDTIHDITSKIYKLQHQQERKGEESSLSNV